MMTSDVVASDESASPGYPPPPWRLIGEAVGLLRLVDCRVAAQYVPAGADLVKVWPGKTLGGVMLGVYGNGSTLHYHELIVFCAMRRGQKVGAWISHIYVDHPASVAGGREIWSLPKELAEFRFEADACVITQGTSTLCRLHWTEKKSLIPMPLWLPAWGYFNGRLSHFTARGKGGAGACRISLEVPADSPFCPLIESGTRTGLRLNPLDITVGAPDLVAR